MDYEKLYFMKTEMSQIVPTNSTIAPETYAAYANSFDLSLLPTDNELPLSPQSDFSPSVSLDYIPTTVYQDPQPLPSIKVEKTWNEDMGKTQSAILFQHLQQLYPSPLPSPPQDSFAPAATVYPPSPCPSLDHSHPAIKQELLILPPSPPESSCGAPSPHSFGDVKNEPESEVEALIDINSLLDLQSERKGQDHQVLREYLEDTSFQKKHNLKPLALESLIGGLGGRGDIEPVISLALEHARRDAQDLCAKLQISIDPQQWTPAQAHAWLRSTVEHFQLPPIDDLETKFAEDGAALALLSEEEFMQRAPEIGLTIHAQLEIWKLACSDTFQLDFMTTSLAPSSGTWIPDCSAPMDLTDDEDDETPPTTSGPTKPVTARSGGSHIHLWQFLKELLATPQMNGTAIRWLDRTKGVFKIEDSVRVAKLWGRRKNRPAMNYDKLSRSIRQYYKKGIMKKTERSQRLVYQFCHPYSL